MATLLLVRGCLTAEGISQELKPSDDLFSVPDVSEPYHRAVRAALLEEHRYRLCQVLAIPSFQCEWAVYLLREDDGKTQVVSKRLRQPLWGQMMDVLSGGGTKKSYSLGAEAQEAALKQMPKDIDTSTASIAPELADLLEDVWWKMLGRVHYTEDRTGNDGITYHVSHWRSGVGFRSGTTWSPDSGSRPAALVGLAERMAELAKAAPGSARESAEAALTTDARALLNQLK